MVACSLKHTEYLSEPVSGVLSDETSPSHSLLSQCDTAVQYTYQCILVKDSVACSAVI